MLLYGINGSGKSTFGRTVATSIILAQCGLYVPAESFHYTPYSNIMTKMNMSDNIYAQKSTFINEMLELKKFLCNSGPNTLVVADELAKGTELTSELSLVAAAFRALVDSKTTTIFMTHIYELADLQLIKELKNVGVCHISTTVTSNGVQYDRKIIPGRCTKLYGIEVASSLGLSADYITLAMEVRKEWTGENMKTEVHPSKYNCDVIVKECAVCKNKDNLHTHHIIEQNKFIEGHNIPFDKNAAHNLTVLCEKCHNEVHHGRLQINGYVMSTLGVTLDYKWLAVEGNKQ
jgi:DNA mismatch repair protein MutS